MENGSLIQSDSELDLLILHQLATNLFQRTLETYVDSWNNHPVRTEGKKKLQISFMFPAWYHLSNVKKKDNFSDHGLNFSRYPLNHLINKSCVTDL
jgi:hypothetical protein